MKQSMGLCFGLVLFFVFLTTALALPNLQPPQESTALSFYRAVSAHSSYEWCQTTLNYKVLF